MIIRKKSRRVVRMVSRFVITFFILTCAAGLIYKFGTGIARMSAHAQQEKEKKEQCWNNMGDGGIDEIRRYSDGSADRTRTCYGETRVIDTMSAEEMKREDKEEYEERIKRTTPPKPTVKSPTKMSFGHIPHKMGATPNQQELINYAFTETACKGDEQFVTMIEGESGWNTNAVEVLDDGSYGDGISACQVDRRYWPKIHASKKFRTDEKYQIRVCCEMWRSGVRFYGADRNPDMIRRFWWPERKGA